MTRLTLQQQREQLQSMLDREIEHVRGRLDGREFYPRKFTRRVVGKLVRNIRALRSALELMDPKRFCKHEVSHSLECEDCIDEAVDGQSDD